MNASARSPVRVALGVTGGIAAYKSAELVRELMRRDAEVQVIMTPAAEQFITPLTFQALSGRPVRSTLFDPAAEAAMGHIELARWADLVLIAPASADCIARMAAGHANDLLTTTVLATGAPVAVAPAMNQQMWAHPATQRNIATLRGDGVAIWGPGSGDQACGDVGAGRMLEPLELAERVDSALRPKSLLGRTVLITAGPTREPIDPVRYISNHSSGKQGYALATAAAAAGARVVLVSGPVELATPAGVERVDVGSAEEMLNATMAHAPTADIFIAVAAVADYRVASPAEQKIKKVAGAAPPDIQLVQNPDIAQSIATLSERPFSVGFAAETENVVDHARDKLERKALDLIIANDVSDRTIGFGSDENAVTILWRGGELELPALPKTRLAEQMMDIIADHYERYQRGRVGATES